jgi:HSP20 family molecular chaperone IbpA
MSALRDALRELPDAVYADVLESDDAYLLLVDLPGATGKTVDARVERGRLVIDARREKDLPAGFEYVEEERSLFLDVELPLPPDATGEGATGNVDNGVLELTLPKQTDEASATIPIDEA